MSASREMNGTHWCIAYVTVVAAILAAVIVIAVFSTRAMDGDREVRRERIAACRALPNVNDRLVCLVKVP